MKGMLKTLTQQPGLPSSYSGHDAGASSGDVAEAQFSRPMTAGPGEKAAGQNTADPSERAAEQITEACELLASAAQLIHEELAWAPPEAKIRLALRHTNLQSLLAALRGI